VIYFLISRGHKTQDVLRLISHLEARTLQKIGKDFYVSGKRNELEFFDNDICVRWGAKYDVDCRTINSLTGVMNASNKRKARQLLEGRVDIPKTWYDIKEARVPFIARPSTHTHGRNFIVVRNERDQRTLAARKRLNGWYFSELLNFTEEYRVYVGGDKALGAWKKQFKPGELRANRAITNLEWEFLMPPEDVAKIAVDAAQVLGIELSGVDVGVTADRVVLIEVNTTPRISGPQVIQCYANYINGCFLSL